MDWRRFYRLLDNELTWVVLFFLAFLLATFYFLNVFAGLLYALVVYLLKLAYEEGKRTHKYIEAHIKEGADHGKEAEEDEL